MISAEYPDDCVTEAELDGPLSLAFDDDDEELDENESPDSSIGYGSLLGLGSSMRKKQPLIVVDPVEAENEARRVQFVAAQQLAGTDESEAIDFLQGLAHFAEPEVPEADVLGYVIPPADGDDAIDDQVDVIPGIEMLEPDMASDDPFCDVPIDTYEDGGIGMLRVDEVAGGASESLGAADEAAEAPDCEVPDEAGGVDPIAGAGELETATCEAPCPQSRAAPPGHSLRTRIPARQSSRTFTDRAVAFLAWLHDWLTRSR
jgi:hypothetical protein